MIVVPECVSVSYLFIFFPALLIINDNFFDRFFLDS